ASSRSVWSRRPRCRYPQYDSSALTGRASGAATATVAASARIIDARRRSSVVSAPGPTPCSGSASNRRTASFSASSATAIREPMAAPRSTLINEACLLRSGLHERRGYGVEPVDELGDRPDLLHPLMERGLIMAAHELARRQRHTSDMVSSGPAASLPVVRASRSAP